MINISNAGRDVFVIDISNPRNVDDEDIFLDFLNEVLKYESFGLILSVEGNKFFSTQGKKALGIWFKLNKKFLGKNCRGFARVSATATKLEKLKSKALRLAMPCPYVVLTSTSEALAWISKEIDPI